MHTVDDLRARLRELGYLDAGVDRFVLGAASRGRGLFAVAARASARIGVLAALLLGPSAAIALAARLPGLVTGIRDALVLALYLSLFFGAAVAVVAFGVSVLLGHVAARAGGSAVARARLLGKAAGLLVGAGCLVYLVFWWRAVSGAGSAGAGGGRTLLVLAWAAFVSVLLGHAVHLTTLALMARSGERGPAWPGRISRRWSARLALGMAGFAAAGALLWVTTRHQAPGPAPAASAPLAARPTGVSLTVVAIDGVDLELVERLRGEGRLPVLARMLEGPRLRLPASDAPDPARTWTSLATGLPPEVHGVGGIEARRVSGIGGRAAVRDSGLAGSIAAATDLLRLTRPVLTTGMERRAKTFWEVAGEAGLSTRVVNWWASWPAEGPGTILSDRTVLRLERGGALDAEVAPADLYPRLLDAWPSVREAAARQVAEAFPGDSETAAILRRAGLQDALPVALAVAPAGRRPALEAIYLPGLDIAQYELLVRPGSGLPPSALAARVEAVERYYAFLDGLLRPFAAGEGRLVALITDPGRSPVGQGEESPGGRASPGLLVLSGSPPVLSEGPAGADSPAGRVALDAERADVMPTLLFALGVPISRELPGRPATRLFDPRFVEAHPPRELDTYGRRVIPPRPPGSAPLDQEMLDRLRSLGYVR